MRAALILTVAASFAGTALAEPHAPPAPATSAPATAAPAAPAKPIDPALQAVLDKIATGDDAARKAALDDLAKRAPHAVDGLAAFLARPHVTDLADRHKVLDAIKAAVPDKAGHFVVPQRRSPAEEQADDDLDWMASLVKLDPAMPGLGEVIADDAAIRALAGTKDPAAAQVLFDVAIAADTVIYRDECGRYLRRMMPYSIPALTRESQGDGDRKRYATFQLERLDRQEPGKALASATGDEALEVAILEVFRATKHREAVHAVWSKVDADSPRVRAKAREAWEAYITGPPPRPAPRKKLVLPGGKLTKKEKPLWLTYRELADNELRKAANELLHEDYPLADPSIDDSEYHKVKTVAVDLGELTTRLFKFYDDARIKRDAVQWAAAKALADKGDLAGATTMLDSMLAAKPERGDASDRAAMAKVYFAWAKQLEAKQQWDGAAAAYSKAYGLDSTGASSKDALAAASYSQGKALEAKGLDGGPDFRRAIELKPDYAPAKTAARDEAGPRPSWMLYIAGGAAGLALVLFAAGMVRRRA